MDSLSRKKKSLFQPGNCSQLNDELMKLGKLLSKTYNGEPSLARWQQWSRIKDVSFCFKKKICASKIKTTDFHSGPVLPPSGDGSPFCLVWYRMKIILLFYLNVLLPTGISCNAWWCSTKDRHNNLWKSGSTQFMLPIHTINIRSHATSSCSS